MRNFTRRNFLCFTSAPITSLLPAKPSIVEPINLRRVVTGNDSAGKSKIISDGSALRETNHFEDDKHSICTLWVQKQVPANISNNTETLDGYTFSFEDWDGVTVVMVTCEPGFSGSHHRTQTIDFVFIISGSIELIMDEGKTVLSAGDTVVQRATLHSWRTVGNQPCKFAAVLVGAMANEPK